jgi:hypothetical protein
MRLQNFGKSKPRNGTQQVIKLYSKQLHTLLIVRRDFFYLRILLEKTQVGRSEKKIKKNINVFQDCHNDNMSQKYLESKFTWRVLHVRTPN